MSEVTEKRTFKIPPCKIDKVLVKRMGEILEKESSTIYNDLLEFAIKKESEKDYYKKYPDQLEEDAKSSIAEWEYKPEYTLVAHSRNIESTDISGFTKVDWPSDTESLSVSIGRHGAPKRIEIDIYLESWRMNESKLRVSGNNSTWVNGIADQLEAIFQKNLVGYHLIVEKLLLRVLLSILAWISIAFAVAYPLWPAIRPFLKPSVTFPTIFAIILLIGFVVFYPLELFMEWLFPRFEFGPVSLSRRVRKWMWGLLVSSGLIVAIIFKLVGLA